MLFWNNVHLMQKDNHQLEPVNLFGRVVSILETARANVVRTVNSEMVAAYWLIGREVVEEVQRGKGRAKYGKTVIDNLSVRLNERFGKGFSESNLILFRRFYLEFENRSVGGISELSTQCVDNSDPMDGTPPFEFSTHCVRNSAGFMPSLGWSHYRALMRVEHPAARTYYEREAAANSWSVRPLEAELRKERRLIEESIATYGASTCD